MEKKTGEHHFCFGANLTIPELIRIFNKKQNELNFLLAQGETVFGLRSWRDMSNGLELKASHVIT